ncbi:hypothetical protein MMC28_005606 [Mycoblastus sanguinarius]|nr:hypothetical protein [Mycoblastus sanguinarius]
MASGPLFNALEKWLSLCDIDGSQSEMCYEEICRLEIFDRLGMAHTCCGHRRSCMKKKDRKQLQEEDTELKEQLDLILRGYQNRYKRHVGGLNDFWKSSMQDLDRILPELMSEERCRRRCLPYNDYVDYNNSTEYWEKEREWHDLRMKIEEEALTKRGYSRLDFIDVIRHHFSASLGSGSSNPAENSY